MDEQRTYAWDERTQYDPGTCLKCGSDDVTVEWRDAGHGQWLPGLKTCRNPKCVDRLQPEDFFG